MRAIDADKLREKKVLVYSCFGAEAEGVLLEDIDNAPTITPDSLVKRGRWILKDEKGKGVCSECNRQDGVDPLAKYCRFCGALMED